MEDLKRLGMGVGQRRETAEAGNGLRAAEGGLAETGNGCRAKEERR